MFAPISTSLSRDVLSEGQILHFLFLQCMTLFPMQGELSEARIQISFTSHNQTLVSTCYPFSCFLRLGQSQHQRTKFLSVPCTKK